MTASHLTVVDSIPDAPTEPADNDSADAGITADSDTDEIVVPPCPRIPISLIAPHPDNKREDLDLNEEFIASIRANGVEDPIGIVLLPEGTEGPAEGAGSEDKPKPKFRVVDGHRRYFGGLMAEVEDVPVYLSAGKPDDLASQYLTMFNTSRHTAKLTPIEEASALFAASQAGASQTAIRSRTGLGRAEVKSAIKAGGLSKETKAKIKGVYGLTIDQLALLGEFEDDEAAAGEILREIISGGSGQHAAERIRQHRALKAEAAAARKRYAADGFTVTESLPDGARYLNELLQDGADLTPEMHASCPGRGIRIPDWDPAGTFYCSDPDAHGHVYRFAAEDPGEGTDDTGEGDSTPEPESEAPSHRLVREGNVAWTAAGKVRRKWLKDLCARTTIPRDAQLFAAKQVLLMPPNVASKLGGARNEGLFRELTGWAGNTDDATRLDGWKPGKLPVIQFALVAAAYETLLTGKNGALCWRPTAELRFPPVSREDAGAYFAHLSALGYQLSTIEQAMADDVPYEGEPGLDEPAAPAVDA